jgi:hypothetical protein
VSVKLACAAACLVGAEVWGFGGASAWSPGGISDWTSVGCGGDECEGLRQGLAGCMGDSLHKGLGADGRRSW